MRPENSETLAVQQRIREAGLRATAPRVVVLGALDGARGPLTHGQVHQRLAVQGLDRATVYRNLRDLSEAGLLLRTDLGDHVWRYVVSPVDGGEQAEAHPHFFCTACGAVTCLPPDAVTLHSGQDLPRALRGNAVDVTVKGLCDTCE